MKGGCVHTFKGAAFFKRTPPLNLNYAARDTSPLSNPEQPSNTKTNKIEIRIAQSHQMPLVHRSKSRYNRLSRLWWYSQPAHQSSPSNSRTGLQKQKQKKAALDIDGTRIGKGWGKIEFEVIHGYWHWAYLKNGSIQTVMFCGCEEKVKSGGISPWSISYLLGFLSCMLVSLQSVCSGGR